MNFLKYNRISVPLVAGVAAIGLTACSSNSEATSPITPPAPSSSLPFTPKPESSLTPDNAEGKTHRKPTDIGKELVADPQAVPACTNSQMPAKMLKVTDNVISGLTEANLDEKELLQLTSDTAQVSTSVMSKVGEQLEAAGGGSTQLAQPKNSNHIVLHRRVAEESVSFYTYYNFRHNKPKQINDICRTSLSTMSSDGETAVLTYSVGKRPPESIRVSRDGFTISSYNALGYAALASGLINALIPSDANFNLPDDLKTLIPA